MLPRAYVERITTVSPALGARGLEAARERSRRSCSTASTPTRARPAGKHGARERRAHGRSPTARPEHLRADGPDVRVHRRGDDQRDASQAGAGREHAARHSLASRPMSTAHRRAAQSNAARTVAGSSAPVESARSRAAAVPPIGRSRARPRPQRAAPRHRVPHSPLSGQHGADPERRRPRRSSGRSGKLRPGPLRARSGSMSAKRDASRVPSVGRDSGVRSSAASTGRDFEMRRARRCGRRSTYTSSPSAA